MVVDQLDNLKQVVLLELDKSVGHLLNVIRLLLLLAAALDLARLTVLIGGQGASLAQDLLQTLRGVLEGDRVGLLVAVLLEVEIVGNGDLALLGVVQIDVHLELTPSLVLTGERRGGEG